MKRTATSTPLTERLSALSEPLRLRMCRVLEQHELSVGEMAKVVQLPQSTVSRHLKALTSAGWTDKRAEGTATLYRMVMDDLPETARRLWAPIREQFDDPHGEEDARRVKACWAERRTDSQAFFGRLGGDWERVRHELFGESFTAEALLALLPSAWTVADLGCGVGNGATMMAPFVREVILVDRSPTMLDAARERLAEHANVRFVEGELSSLPLDDASVDGAVCLLVLHHLPDPDAALREMRRVIRPGGLALILDMVEHDRTEFRHTMGHAHLGFGDEEIRSMIEGAGLRARTVRRLPSRADARGPGLFVAVAERPPEP